MSEQTEKGAKLNPELKEDDIPYDIQVDPDDELGDAKQHVRHAESKIHALRARLRNRSPRKAKVTISESFQTDGMTTSGMTTTTTTTTTTGSEVSTMSIIRQQIMEYEQKLKDRQEVSLDYQKKLENIGSNDGLITNLRSERDELRIKASNATSLLSQSLEETNALEARVNSMFENVSELSKMQDETIKLKESLMMKEKHFNLQTSSNNEQVQILEEKNTELLKLREEGEQLAIRLSSMSGRTNEERVRLLEEKETLDQELVRSNSEIADARELNTKLLKDVEDWKEQGSQLTTQLTERDHKLKTLEVSVKGLKGDAALLAKQQRQLVKLNQEFEGRNDELEVQRRRNSQLVISQKEVNEEIQMQKLRFEKNAETYLDLEKRMNEVQSKSSGESSKESVFLERMASLRIEIDGLKLKYETEFSRNEDFRKENLILKEKFHSSQTLSLQRSRRIRETLDEQVVKETKLKKVNVKIKNELADVVAASAKNEQMYLTLKKMYDEKKSDRKARSSTDQKKFEEDLRKKIIQLQKKAARKNVRLSKARDLQTQRKRELATRGKRLKQCQLKLKKKDDEIIVLENRLSRMSAGKRKKNVDNKLIVRIKTLEGTLESLRAEAMKHQKSEVQIQSEIESQLRLMKSKDEMIKARDEKIRKLKNAKRRADGSVNLSKSDVNDVFFGIQVTSVVDHRGNKNHRPKFYKHEVPLADYHDHVLRVDSDPEYHLESEVETIMRRKKLAASKKRKLHDRRPSLG